MRLTADKIPLGGTGLAEGAAVCYPVIEQGGTLRRPPTVERRREPVKITVEHRAGAENEVVLRCAALDEEMLWVLSLLRSGLQRLCVWSESREVVLLRPEEVVYCESVDERTFVYTADGVYQSRLGLSELEARYGTLGLFRAGKPLLVNLHHIRSLRSRAGGRIEATLETGERLMVSRHYAPLLREQLGL